ncbi:periplasmic heavy metal sensor [Defluviimonas sp. WL0024]|uniref:Periplasmic heavy metal sensor n=2 Tax=Albidovulum TaxID=205889 RepID=A0ABT3J2B5_9RHOB|nr:MULTISPECIES: periplasmic heavy metal sensor [Defluviimonas]MCU9847771.1 periplasmic heavy metal sensor [Defluviimonas sp. WL0024]MCW3781800.1 periplasmic heavy metal sensor [Defluviimonas salinarum]
MAEPEKTGKRGGGWLKWALIASLGLNFFVVAVIAGSVAGHHRGGGHWRPHDVGFGPFTEALSREDRAALRDAFLAARPDFRDMRREARGDFERLVASLRAEPWDPAAVSAAMAAQGARTAQRLELGQRLLVERISQMSPEARHKLADRIEAATSRRWWR